MTSTPSIRISQPRRPPTPSAQPAWSASASPMAIPHAREAVPPPLPPPSYIPELHAGQDPGWQWGNDPNRSDFGRPATVKPGSSLLGGGTEGVRREQEAARISQNSFNDGRRGSSISTVTGGRGHEMPDETSGGSEEHTSTSRPSTNYGLQSERQLSRGWLEESSQSYDKQLLNSLGGPNTPKRGSTASILGTLQENQQLAPHEIERRRSSLRPLSVPESKQNALDSPSSKVLSSGAVSPGFTGFWSEHGPAEHSRAPTTRQGSLTFDDSISHRGSYDHSLFLNDEYGMEEGPMSNLHLHDRSPGSPRSGSKRRASSPPRQRDDRSSLSSASGHSEIYHRRSMQQLPNNRTSPVSRFHPNHSSVSSASSFGPRHGSLGSSLSIPSVPSSATSYASGRISPGGVSPALDPEYRMSNVYPTLRPSNPAAVAQHQRTLSESVPVVSSRKMSASSAPHSRHGSLSQMQGVLICECCPKKPKKFDTEEELRVHESEKQYTCTYCNNRFKNKNEAERHQNSLHLRKHSWSCAVLSGPEAAFHPSPNGPQADACGYCGKDFPNPAQWDVRAEHLNTVHKFGECNQAKKFFRADHFRQHLKHSHHGTSGKWTNMLENACMRDEPPPLPVQQQQDTTPTAPPILAPAALVVRTAGGPSATGPGAPGTATIDESSNES